MGLFKKIIGGGTNKNDVKIAKLELEKAKIEKETKKSHALAVNESKTNLNKPIEIDGYLEYSKINFDMMQNIVLTLKNDIEMALKKIQNSENTKLSGKEKSQLKKDKNSCKSKLKYLYLSKDFLANLSKFASGIGLNEEQTSLVLKFAPYFDGIQVLETEEDDVESEEESFTGMFKKTAKDFKSFFNGSKSSKPTEFYFYEYLEKYYDKKIDQFELPEVVSVIEIFKKTVFTKKESNMLVKENTDLPQNPNECHNCHAKVSSDAKFCPECGDKIEIKKSIFCKECGLSLETGTKFCPNCGHKVL